MSSGPRGWRDELDRLKWQALAVGIVCLLPCVIGAGFSPAQFFRAYLAAYQFYLGITLGCFAILMIYYLTGGAWGYLVRRILESSMRALPLMAVLFTPIAYGVGYLYVWARPGVLAAHPDLRHQGVYLNPPFFWGRVALYFIVWTAIAFCLQSWSRREEETGDERYTVRLYWLAGPGLVLYGITTMFAAVDWEMSLQPAFRSSLFGVVFALGQVVEGLAFAVVLLSWLAHRSPLGHLVAPQALTDLASLLFGFLLIWSYAYFFQFMLIWIADLPSEVIWYLVRGRGGWGWVGLALFLFLFVTPFFLLLIRKIKADPRKLGFVAGLVLFMRLVCVYDDIMPNFPGTYIGQHWMDFLTPLGIGGLWFSFFLWQLTRQPLLARHDANREFALHLEQVHLQEAIREGVIHHA
jgi:hypothetical protein